MVISICLSGSWWFHKVQSVEASSFTIDNSNVTFTEGMVKRMAPGPFSAGVLKDVSTAKKAKKQWPFWPLTAVLI